MTRITLTTFKSFIRKNRASLHIRHEADFDGMTDSVEINHAAAFRPAKDAVHPTENNLGISGIWLVRGSRNEFSAYEDGRFVGLSFSNCCGWGTVAVPKNEVQP